jgi:chromosome segregation ATPase
MDLIRGLISRYLLPIKVIGLVLTIIALWVAWHRFTGHYIDIGRQEVQIKFDEFKNEQIKLVAAQKAKDLANRNEATKAQENIKLHYEKQIADLNLDRENIKKELNNALPRIRSLLSDVRVYQNRANISGVSENVEYSKLLTESAGDCNSTVAVLTKAGQSCALDYQALYEWVLSEKKAVNGEYLPAHSPS